MKIIKSALYVLFFFNMSVLIFGQSNIGKAAEIIYVEGDNFDILDSSGKSLNIDPYNAIGVKLEEGDIVLTYEDTFIELELLKSNHVVKIAENTDFRLESIKANGETKFKMLYGSVRARVGRLTGNERFIIKSNEAVAGVRGTDFGMTVVVPKEGKTVNPETSVYCFKGEVEVIPVLKASFKGKSLYQKPLIIKENEMVSIAPLETEEPVKKEEIKNEILEYWEKHDFRGNVGNVGSAGNVGNVKRKEKIEKKMPLHAAQKIKREILRDIKSLSKKRNNYIGMGIILTSAGFMLESAGALSVFYSNYVSSIVTFTSPNVISGSFVAGGGVFLSAAAFTFIRAKILENKINELKSMLSEK